DPLSPGERDTLFDDISLYRDANADGAFESNADTKIAPASVFTNVAGHHTFTFADGDADVQAAFGTPATFFVVVQTAPDATLQTPHTFRVTALLTTGSTAEDV